jgi:undecaprenyl diphosphate synthase
MNVPHHIGIIMDGNGRWAKKRGLPRFMGHRAGTDATRAIVRAAGELGVEYLTIYVFSAENWARPMREINFLMDLLVEMIQKEVANLDENNVKLHAIGDQTKLPDRVRQEVEAGITATAANTGLNLILALSYGGRDENVKTVKKIFAHAFTDPPLGDSLDEARFARYLYTAGFPDPELIIRTGGDIRTSNFLLWQSAYAELYITDVLWPDFDKQRLTAAIEDFNRRERRFGKVLDPQ